MYFWEYFCPTWSEGVKGSAHVFPCLSQSALHHFLPALCSWRLWMSHLIQSKENLSLCRKKHLCWSTFIREKPKMTPWCYTSWKGWIHQRQRDCSFHSLRQTLFRHRVNRNTQTHTSVHSFWNSAAAKRVKAPALMSTGGFHGNCPPFLLRGRASH